MKIVAKAYAPANISCIFQIYENPDPAKMGSYGLGFTIDQGVTVEISISSPSSFPRKRESSVHFNHKKIEFPTINSVVQKLLTRSPSDLNIKINITSGLPLGYGFGLSGASALATAYALNKILKLNISELELAKTAHTAEVENKTGLGDIVNQYYGGFLLKLKPSSEFEVEKIQLIDTSVYCKYFSKISTEKILSNTKLRKSINEAAQKALDNIKKTLVSHSHHSRESGNPTPAKINFSDLITISKNFALESGLLTDKNVIKTIEEIESAGGHASMIMLGKAVFSDTPFPGSVEFKISNTPAHLK